MTVDKPNVRTAAKLLAKAESTDVDAEAIAFVERSYRVLAQIITVHDAEAGRPSPGARRRDRRHLQERRAVNPRSEPARQVGPAAPAAYRNVSEGSARADHTVDLTI